MNTDPNHLLYPQERRRKELPPFSYRPVLVVFLFFLFCMTLGGGTISLLFQKVVGGGIAETYLYPIYGGIVLLAVLITVCTCLILEALRDLKIPD